MPQDQQAATDSVRESIFAAREPGLLLASLQEAWLQPSPLLDPDSIGNSKPPSDAHIRRVHYRPGKAGRLVVELSGVEARRQKKLGIGSVYLALLIYPSLKQAEKRFRSLAEGPLLRTPGPPLMLLPRFNAVATCLPNSPRLRKMRFLLQPKKFRALLEKHNLPTDFCPQTPGQGLQLVRLVPRKRAVFRYGTLNQAFYIKFFTKDDHQQAAVDMRRMTELQLKHALAFRVPTLLAHDAKAHVVVMDELPGEQVTKHYAERDPALWDRCGAGLASLHAVQLPQDAPVWTPTAELQAIEVGCRDMLRALPHLRPRIEQLLQRLHHHLAKVEVYEPRAIHANLFGDQMLDDGQQLSIVDWEDLCHGDPCFDVGRLGAHILACAVTSNFPLDQAQRALVRIEQAHRNGLGDNLLPPKRFAWYLVGALLLRAKIRSLRQLPPRWQGEIEDILQLAEDVCAGRVGPWRLA